ncbi:aspartate--tRNA(Asn) ligase [Microbacterium bovistercoris]|uniref:Aspartate--tRNA(Asp/Asn) ligase n=1 Tax=Microbacterium bovistercoris TaxID=2293570 RepID=A0A371NUP8_9MICO|nr:aspartate--tRNA(Asn) ligase [Microbacterium bovistercoris]REJ05519.1 aspartate--tRNA(Asn) ligase [Microbacterium bovistercoris]
MKPPVPSRTLAAELTHAEPGTEVRLQGHVHRRRELATVSFLIIRDRSGLAQVVVRADEIGDDGLPPEETVVDIVGIATANAHAPGGIEVVSPVVTLLTEPAATPPVELWRPALTAGLPTLLDNAPVTWRHPAQRAKWQIASASLQGFRATLDAAGFTEIQTPKLVASATESGANVFPVDYFGRQAFLAQSPQFYKQQLVGVFERVYEVGPVFRAEPHDTVRHLAEYVSLDVEFGFISDHHDVLRMLRTVLTGMTDAIAMQAGEAVELLQLRLPSIPDEIPVIHFSEALTRVGAPADEPDLAPEHERILGDWALREFGSDVLAVEGYPMRKRPFYTHPQPDDTRWSNSFDLIFRGLELVTGGQRLHRYGDYVEALTARGESPAAYEGYLQTFAHGMPPHGGFAIGLERWVGRLIEAPNIREVTLFPRDVHRLTP